MSSGTTKRDIGRRVRLADGNFRMDLTPLDFNASPPRHLGNGPRQQPTNNNIVENDSIFRFIRCPELRREVFEFLLRAHSNWSLGLLVPSDLSPLTRINAFDALVRNAMALHIPLEYLEGDDFHSQFNMNGSQLSNTPAFPVDLCSTPCQRAIVHHSWLDLFPFPAMRDNILRGIQAGYLDEDEMCEEFCCGLLDLNEDSTSYIVIWGDPWDASGWEFSPGFFAKWAPLLHGCPQILTTTNYWRERRGESRLNRLNLTTSEAAVSNAA